MPNSYTTDVKNLSKVELNNGACNLAFADLPEVGESLLIVGVPPNIAICVANVKAGVVEKPVLFEVFINTTTPEINPGDSFYTASFAGRCEIRS